MVLEARSPSSRVIGVSLGTAKITRDDKRLRLQSYLGWESFIATPCSAVGYSSCVLSTPHASLREVWFMLARSRYGSRDNLAVFARDSAAQLR